MEEILDRLQRLLSARVITPLLLVALVGVVGFIGWKTFTLIEGETTTTETLSRQQEFSNNNFIVSKIPYRTPFYSITYDRHGTDPVTIKIFTPSPYYRSQAIYYLQKYDQEVTVDHPIIFEDYQSPLTEAQAR